MEVIASRDFNQLFIYLDIFFLVGLSALLFYSRRYMTIIFGLLGGIIYFLVDYGIFYKLLGTRVINGAQPFVFLLWLSMSYGFTNFAWIWLFLNRDKRFWEWSTFIVAGWLAVALLSQNFGSGFQQISISRGTSSYHGFMALVLFAGYAFLVILNIRNEKRGGERIDIKRLLFMGILVQFSWEFILLITGIRAAGIMPLTVNSLLETNLGMPIIFFIHRAVTRFYSEDLRVIRTVELDKSRTADI
ncbi:MAG: hypothetical protein R3232_10340 [Clostridia bacterium]|nr:hypothetical protein [Clostridia bacterium]